MSPSQPPLPISAVILAGGQGSRMGGDDKGLLLLAGQPLIAHVLARIRPQVDEIILSVNRNVARYAAFGYPLVTDAMPGFHGPLAGMLAGMLAARHDLALVAPCDTPFLPTDLVARLRATLLREGTDLAVASAAGRRQPTVMLARRGLTASLANFLASGGRKVGEWQSRQRSSVVAFDHAEDFRNLNSPQELAAAETEILNQTARHPLR